MNKSLIRASTQSQLPVKSPHALSTAPDHHARKALAVTVESMLERQARYAVVTYDERGRLVIFDVVEECEWDLPHPFIGVEYFRAELNTANVQTTGSGLFSTSLKKAEKRKTAVVKWLRSLDKKRFDRDDNCFWLAHKRCAELVTIIKLGTFVTAIHPTSRAKPKQSVAAQSKFQTHDTQTDRKTGVKVQRGNSVGVADEEMDEVVSVTTSGAMKSKKAKPAAPKPEACDPDNSHNWGFRGRINQRRIDAVE